MELRDCQYRELFCALCHEKFAQRTPTVLPCNHILCSLCAQTLPNQCSRCGDLRNFRPVPEDLRLVETIQKLGELYRKLERRDLTAPQKFAATNQVLLYLNEVPTALNQDLDCLYGSQCPFKGCVYTHPEQRARASNLQVNQVLGDSVPPSLQSSRSSMQSSWGSSGFSVSLEQASCLRCAENIDSILPFCVKCGNPIGEIVGGKVLYQPSANQAQS